MPARRSDEAKLWKDKDIFWKAAVITAGAKCWSGGAKLSSGMADRCSQRLNGMNISATAGVKLPLAGRRRFLSATNGGWQEGDASCQLRMAAGRKEALPVSYEWKLAGRRRFLPVTPPSLDVPAASFNKCRKIHGLEAQR